MINYGHLNSIILFLIVSKQDGQKPLMAAAVFSIGKPDGIKIILAGSEYVRSDIDQAVRQLVKNLVKIFSFEFLICWLEIDPPPQEIWDSIIHRSKLTLRTFLSRFLSF